MATTDQLDIVSLMRNGLEEAIKIRLTEQLIEKFTEEINEKIESIIKTEVQKLTFEAVNSYRDLAHIRDEIRVTVDWKE